MDERVPSGNAPIAGEVFAAIMAGSPQDACLDQLRLLPEEDRQTVLCTLCVMRAEINANCTERGAEMDEFLGAACPFYCDGKRCCVERAR